MEGELVVAFHNPNPFQNLKRAIRSDVDVHVADYGSVALVHLDTPEAPRGVEENVSADAPFFGTALVVQPRYVAPLIASMFEAGLEVR